ncbi:putative calmodulin-3 [Pecten maximus]|uniref:putative calmodulin-3 n=1 Tax=Pecten maximus TaxID=6579 RepID=UPI001458C854|nr:putative calmodulin-3 [Pecten maximus]
MQQDRLDVGEDFEKRIMDSFKRADEDNSGYLDARELGLVMRELGFNPTESDLEKIDTDDNGKIEFNELRDYVIKERKKLLPPSELEKQLCEAFGLFDTFRKGFLTSDELKVIMKERGETVTEEDYMEFIQEADDDQDGHVNYNVFIKKMICEYY